MESTYRGPVCRGPMKRTPLREPYEEGPFEIMREGLLDSLFPKGFFELWKRLYAVCLLEEGPFTEGPVCMVYLQRAS